MVLAIILATVLLAVPAALADTPGGGQQPVDISVTEVRIDVEEPMQDDEVNVTATILSNRSFDDVTVVFLVDQREIGNVTNISLVPGVPEEATTVWVTTAGTHVVKAIVSLNGTPLPDSDSSIEVYVEAKPVGDVATLLYGLLAIALVVLGMTVVPSIIFRLTGW